jgi:hypothetical protein
MRMIDAVGARLNQSVKMMANLGIDLPSADPSAENRIRGAIWRCILCRHGSECSEWIQVARPGVPSFCSNREFYLGRIRDKG